jgi:methyltransferase, FkbM family
MSNETIISVNSLNKIYRLYDSPQDRLKESLHPFRKKYHHEFYALKQVSVDIYRGETVGIIGKNGSGKSTLLKLIAGVLTPSSGNITVNGKISALLELGAGFNPELTGIENVYFNGIVLGYTKEEIEERLEDILQFAEIGDFIYQPVKTYSSGMFVRLAFAVAINVEPDILIVDEALSVGDIRFQAKCFRKIEQLKDRGTTILFVSHDLGSIRAYCNRTILINNGQIHKIGNSDDVCTSYHLMIRAEQVAEECKAKSIPLPNSSLGKILSVVLLDENGNSIDTFESGSMLKVRIRVKAYENIGKPAVSFCIQNLQGINLLGLTTFYENAHIQPLQAGQELTIEFNLRLSIHSGTFTTSVGFANQTDYDLVQVIEDYDKKTITIFNKKRTFGLFTPSDTSIEFYEEVDKAAEITQAIVRIGEYKISLNLNNRHEKNYYECINGTATDFDILIAQRFLKPGDTVLDAGANIGFSSLIFLKYGAQKVYAFEPVPYLFERLKSISNEKLIVFRVALSDMNGSSKILLSQTHDQGHSLNSMFTDIFPAVFGEVPVTTEVTVKTLDTALPEVPLHFYKVDIEGSEANFIDGASHILSTSPPRVMMIEIYPQVFDYTHSKIKSYFKYVKRAAITANGVLRLLDIEAPLPKDEPLQIDPPVYIYCNDESLLIE